MLGPCSAYRVIAFRKTFKYVGLYAFDSITAYEVDVHDAHGVVHAGLTYLYNAGKLPAAFVGTSMRGWVQTLRRAPLAPQRMLRACLQDCSDYSAPYYHRLDVVAAHNECGYQEQPTCFVWQVLRAVPHTQSGSDGGGGTLTLFVNDEVYADAIVQTRIEAYDVNDDAREADAREADAQAKKCFVVGGVTTEHTRSGVRLHFTACEYRGADGAHPKPTCTNGRSMQIVQQARADASANAAAAARGESDTSGAGDVTPRECRTYVVESTRFEYDRLPEANSRTFALVLVEDASAPVAWNDDDVYNQAFNARMRGVKRAVRWCQRVRSDEDARTCPIGVGERMRGQIDTRASSGVPTFYACPDAQDVSRASLLSECSCAQRTPRDIRAHRLAQPV